MALGVLCEPVRAELHRLAAEKRVCIDSRYGLHTLAGFHSAKPNEPELQLLTGVPVGTDEGLLRAGREALDLLECAAVLVTRGRKGMVLFEKSGHTAVPVHGARDAVDVTGAGDTVMATFTLGVGRGSHAARRGALGQRGRSLGGAEAGDGHRARFPELRAELERD